MDSCTFDYAQWLLSSVVMTLCELVIPSVSLRCDSLFLWLGCNRNDPNNPCSAVSHLAVCFFSKYWIGLRWSFDGFDGLPFVLVSFFSREAIVRYNTKN